MVKNLSPNPNLRVPVVIAGFFVFSVLMTFAVIFYQERAITFDMARQGFYNILTQKTVSNLRFGAIIPQLIPLAFVRLHASLQIFMLAESTGIIIFYFTLFLIIVFALKQYKIAIVFLLNMLLLVNDTFYWIQSELPQGLAWLILYYAYLEKNGIEDIKRKPIIHFALLLFIQFFHPVMIFPVVYVLLFSVYQNFKLQWSNYLMPLMIAAGIFCIRILVGKLDSYENAKLDFAVKLHHHQAFILQLLSATRLFFALFIAAIGVIFIAFYDRLKSLWLVLMIGGSAVILYALHLLHLASISKLIAISVTNFAVYWIVLAIVVIIYICNRKFYQLGLLLSFTAFYLLLICVMNRFADRFYLENLLLPLGAFLAVSFAQELFIDTQTFYKWAPALLSVIICVRLTFIYSVHIPYTNRLIWYQQQFAEMDRRHTQRLMLTEKNVPMDTLIMSWASGYESVMLSSIIGPEFTKSIVIDSSLTSYQPYLKPDTLLLAKWAILSNRQLPSGYFKLRPGNYLVRN